MAKDFFIGVDIGTSGIRAALFDLEGRERAFCYKGYSLISTERGMAELDPELLLNAFIEVIGGCLERFKTAEATKAEAKDAALRAIGISTQLHSLLAVDKNGDCLTNVFTWADNRSLEDTEYIKANFDCRRLYMNAGCRAEHTIYHISKILWIKRVKPRVFEKTYKFVSIKEYILSKICGGYHIDYTDASASGCFNTHTFKWAEAPLKDILRVDEERFGEPVACSYLLDGLRPEYAARMGVGGSAQVVIGSGDGIMAHLGCGGTDGSVMSSTIGTSGALRIAVDKPLLDERLQTWCYCFTRETWVAGGSLNNGGIVLTWLKDQFGEQFESEAKRRGLEGAYDLFEHYLAETKPGAEGLAFLPFLTGERSPGWHAQARAHICGLTLSHSKNHIVRAAMEGVTFNMYTIFKELADASKDVRRIVANGGYVNSASWLHMQADVFNRELTVAPIAEAAVWGAALNAMSAVGAIKDYGAVLSALQFNRTIRPDADNHTLYLKAYEDYISLYNGLINSGAA